MISLAGGVIETEFPRIVGHALHLLAPHFDDPRSRSNAGTSPGMVAEIDQCSSVPDRFR